MRFECRVSIASTNRRNVRSRNACILEPCRMNSDCRVLGIVEPEPAGCLQRLGEAEAWAWTQGAAFCARLIRGSVDCLDVRAARRRRDRRARCGMVILRWCLPNPHRRQPLAGGHNAAIEPWFNDMFLEYAQCRRANPSGPHLGRRAGPSAAQLDPTMAQEAWDDTANVTYD